MSASTGRPKGRRNRTPAEIAVEAVETEARKRDRLQERYDRLDAERSQVGEELDRANARVDFLSRNPDLPDGYTLPEDGDEPEETVKGPGEKVETY